MSVAGPQTMRDDESLETEVGRLSMQLAATTAELEAARADIATAALAGSVAHDFNNILGVIMANLDLLSERFTDDPDSTGLIGEAMTAALRGADLAHRLLSMAPAKVPQPGPAAPAEPAEILPRAAGETILAVEDNAGLRRVVVRQLKELGYNILEAEDGPAALMILNTQPVDLLFTDVVMPGGMSGYDLARLVLSRWPKMKALITSGFPDLVPTGDSALQGKLKRLLKPYRKADLAEALRDVIDAEPVAP